MKDIAIITAMDQNGTIGRGKLFPWKPTSVPKDMERFKKITGKKALIVGRKTFESLPGTVLERSEVIVLTRRPGMPSLRDYSRMNSPEGAMALAEMRAPNADEVIIGGGAEVYKLFLGLGIVNRMYITFIQKAFIEKKGDIKFPLSIKQIRDNWKIVEEEKFLQDKNNKLDLVFATFERK